jgi:hypothetical protein
MKQLFAIKKFGDTFSEKLQSVAFWRKERLYLQNLDYPADRVKISHSQALNKITIEITINEDEYLAIGSAQGTATKQTIEG